MRNCVGLFVAIILVATASIALASAPNLINYQGRLTNSSGVLINGPQDLVFAIHDAPSGGDPLWSETHTGVNIEEGLFGVILGSITPIPDSLFSDSVRYIGVSVGGTEVVRSRLTSVPYAMKAGFADSAGTNGLWSTDGSNVYRQTGKVGIGSANPAGILQVATTDATPNIVFSRDGSQTSFKARVSQNSGGQDVLYLATLSSDDSGLVLTQGGCVGIGTTNPNVKLDVVGSIARVNGSALPTAGRGLELFFSGDLGYGAVTAYNRDLSDYEDLQLGSGLRVMSNGYVGIGTTSPAAPLDVSGPAQVRSTLSVFGHPTDNYYATMTSRYNYNDPFHLNLAHGDLGETTVLGYGLLDGSSTYGTYLGAHWATKALTITNTTGRVGIGTTNPSYNLHVIGSFCATGAKMAIVPTSQGMTEFYCEEATESWFSDYGEAELVSGRATVELDPIFLEAVTIDNEHSMQVQLQEYDMTNGLVVKRGATGFEIIEKENGRSNGKVGYRVVAKRKGYENNRLASAATASK